MSRMRGPLLCVAMGLAASAPLTPVFADVSSDDLLARHADRTAARDTECESNGRQIVVCADQNEDDRYRLPFETVRADDPANEGVWDERYRIQAEPGHCQGWENVQVGCGAVGVSVGVGGASSGLQMGGLRRVGQ